MKPTSKKLARATIRTPNEDADPLGLFPALYARLKEAYYARLRAFLLKFLLVRLEAAVLRGIVDAGTIQGGPVSFPLTITVYPRDAHGFARVVGKLATTSAELSDEHQPDEQPDAPGDGPYIDTLFGERVPASRLNTKRRRFGRRR
jgi:hypothetical protein